MNEHNLQEAAGRLVANEVRLYVSSLVHTLAKSQGSRWRVIEEEEIYSLTCQAFELSAPVQDWKEAARQAGWIATGAGWTHPDFDAPEQNARMACDISGIDPYEWEVFEHWAVSDWLADKLAEKGERIDKDFAGVAVWGRTTAGQAIAMDGVIQDIVRNL